MGYHPRKAADQMRSSQREEGGGREGGKCVCGGGDEREVIQTTKLKGVGNRKNALTSDNEM